MKFNFIHFIILFFITFSFSGCQLIGDIFKAGVWVGVIAVILVIALIIFLIRKMIQS